MMDTEQYERFAVYFLPKPDPLGAFGAQWLGWDVDHGTAVGQPWLPDAEPIIGAAAKYGFHATLKPPFRLAPRCSLAELETAVAALAARQRAVTLDGLSLAEMGGFLALRPDGDQTALGQLARRVVAQLDRFRAPTSEAELARRRAARLSQRQDDLLKSWGYPYVMEEFRFHMTLSGRLKAPQKEQVKAVLEQVLPPLPSPFIIDDIALVGSGDDGRFRTIRRFSLGQG